VIVKKNVTKLINIFIGAEKKIIKLIFVSL